MANRAAFLTAVLHCHDVLSTALCNTRLRPTRCNAADAVEWGLTHTPDLLSVEFPGTASSSSSNSGMSGSMAVAQPATDSSSVSGEAGPRHVLILGSDGFFDTTSMIDACVAALEHSTALEAAQTLADGALRRWAVETQGVRCDDITVVVAFLPA